MDKRYRQTFLEVLMIVALFLFLICFGAFFLQEGDIRNFKIVYILIMIVFIQSIILYLLRYKMRKNSELDKLSILIEYNQKRREIEQEIEVLTKQLMTSDVANYIDVNRLAFSGQSSYYSDKIVNYEKFFEQFGIQKNTIEVKENSAVFLTPFNKKGELLYDCCHKILSNMNIFLRKTDNMVNKDDILMNIISIIVESELVIVNIDGRNPNVYYELGISHAIGKPTILIARREFAIEDIGFDIRQKRIVLYDSMEDLEKQLLYQINRIRNS